MSQETTLEATTQALVNSSHGCGFADGMVMAIEATLAILPPGESRRRLVIALAALRCPPMHCAPATLMMLAREAIEPFQGRARQN